MINCLLISANAAEVAIIIVTIITVIVNLSLAFMIEESPEFNFFFFNISGFYAI